MKIIDRIRLWYFRRQLEKYHNDESFIHDQKAFWFAVMVSNLERKLKNN